MSLMLACWVVGCSGEYGEADGGDVASGAVLQPGDENPELEQAFASLTASYFQNIDLNVRNCRQIMITFKGASQYRGRTITQFRLYRDDQLINTVTVKPDRSADSPVTLDDGWLFPADRAAHSYVAEVVNDAGQTERSAVIPHTAGACEIGTQSFVIVKLTPSDLPAYSHLANDGDLKKLFESATDERSVYSFYKEVSYGKANLSFVENPGWIDMGITLAEFCGGEDKIWTYLTRKSCTVTPSSAPRSKAINSLKAAIATAYPGKDVIWIFNGMGGGWSAFEGDLELGAFQLEDKDRRGVFHELGHHFGLADGWGLRCPDSLGWFGSALTGISPTPSESACSFSVYGYKFDPMATSGHHFYGLHKLQMGFLENRNVKRLNAVALGRVVSFKLKAVDDPVMAPTVADYRLARYPLGANKDASLLLEYRRQVGSNNQTYLDGERLPAGVYVTLFPGANPTQNTAPKTESLGDLLVPVGSGNTEPKIIIGEPFVDADRQLYVRLDSIDDTKNEVSLTLRHVYAYTGASCVTPKDNMNYVSQGYGCLCDRRLGAFIDKNTTTVECKAGVTPTR